MTKAWTILYHLRTAYSDMTDADIAGWLQICDDREWDAIREAAGLRPTDDMRKTQRKGGTTCSVSRPVKAIVFSKLAGTGNSLPVPPRQNALGGRSALRPRPGHDAS